MQYTIMLYDKKGDAYHFDDSFLPFYSEATIDGMRTEFLREEGYCNTCDVNGVRCHVMIPSRSQPGAFSKLCPVLFHDVFKPKWKISDIA